MAGGKTRVLVVDDSALIRQMIVDHIEATQDLEVAGVAADGQQALDMLASTRPDVVTLDIQMPRMDGLETLDGILARRPLPVLMVSSQTTLGAEITLEALERGAIDYIAKPDAARSAQQVLGDELMRKIRSVSSTNVAHVLEVRRRRAQQRAERRSAAQARVTHRSTASAPAARADAFADKCVAIGISTGGPPALTSLFEALTLPLPPIVIVQHMPPHFTKQLAARLDSLSAVRVKEAATGDVLEPNCAYLAPGGLHLEIRRHASSGKLLVREGDVVSGHRPSVDVMFTSAANIFGGRCLGVIMTGMGRDGVEGCAAVAAGGYVLGQDEATSDIYGMNRVAFQMGHVDRQFSLDDAADTIRQQIQRMWSLAAV